MIRALEKETEQNSPAAHCLATALSFYQSRTLPQRETKQKGVPHGFSVLIHGKIHCADYTSLHFLFSICCLQAIGQPGS